MRTAALVRPAKPEDARPVAEVHVESWRHTYRSLLPDDFLDRLSVDDREAMWLGAFADPDPKSGAFVAETSGRIVGFASFGPSRDEDVPEGTGEVPAIYVHPSMLAPAWAASSSRGSHSLFVTPATRGRPSGSWRRTHPLARRFYEKAGWSWDGAVGTHMFDCANEPVVRYAVDL